MANQNLLTYGLKVTQLKQDYYAPTLYLNGSSIPNESIYCFLSRVDPWTDDNNPPVPTQDQAYIKNVFNNMFAAKKITASNITPVVQRIDWTSGAIYDYYQDNVDMFATNSSGLLIKTFYVKNRYDQVFKCLWNNINPLTGLPGASTDEPFLQPGTYNTNNVFISPNDGYKWKYVYTIDIGNKTKFLDSVWMPVPVGNTTPNATTTFGTGSIDVINVTSGGSGYDVVNSPITVTVVGANSTAVTANVSSVQVVGGVIKDITVINPGANYINADVVITSANSLMGSGATAIAPVSPIGGHGYDPISELGCNHIMFAVEFNADEGGYIPTDIDYRQVGLLINPMDSSANGATLATNPVYDLTTNLQISSGVGTTFQSDELAQQFDSKGNLLFSATVLSFNSTTNLLRVINISGTPVNNAQIIGSISKASRVLLNTSPPTFMKFSGYISYIENRAGVQRSSDGIEQFKFVLSY